MTTKPPSQLAKIKTNRARERIRILASFRLFDIPCDMRAEIIEAIESKEWDWFNDCDGCTLVSEVYWPTKYFPPCLRHDFDWATGRGGWASNVRFYKLMRAYRMTVARSAKRFAGVTLAWYLAYKWIRRGASSNAQHSLRSHS